MNSPQPPALELSRIDVHYGYVKALHGIDFQVSSGEVVALLGDNSAGKSTLLKLMSGTIRPTQGAIRRCGDEVAFHAPSDAAAAGVQMVYQDLALVDPLDIAANLCIGREIVRKGPLGLLGVLDRKAMQREAVSELASLGVKDRDDDPSGRDAVRWAAPGGGARPVGGTRDGGNEQRPASRRADRCPRLRADPAGPRADRPALRPGRSGSCS